METSGRFVYLDSSALVKLVIQEPESGALMDYLTARPNRVSCALARVEVIRAVRSSGFASVSRARQLLDRLFLIRLDETLLDSASEMDPSVLRSLDAIHLAAAQTLGSELVEVITYDLRMAEAADSLGLPVSTPGSS